MPQCFENIGHLILPGREMHGFCSAHFYNLILQYYDKDWKCKIFFLGIRISECLNGQPFLIWKLNLGYANTIKSSVKRLETYGIDFSSCWPLNLYFIIQIIFGASFLSARMLSNRVNENRYHENLILLINILSQYTLLLLSFNCAALLYIFNPIEKSETINFFFN